MDGSRAHVEVRWQKLRNNEGQVPRLFGKYSGQKMDDIIKEVLPNAAPVDSPVDIFIAKKQEVIADMLTAMDAAYLDDVKCELFF